MGTEITVKAGDTLSAYARKFGFTVEKIWLDDANQELRNRRGDPNVLHPGDVVVIPEREEKGEKCSTESRHRFRKLGRLEISVVVLDLHHEPVADLEYSYVVDGREGAPARTDSTGVAKTKIPKVHSTVTLKLPWGDFPVEIGRLDPARSIRGIQQRLRNLGIKPGPIDGLMGPKTRNAIVIFQQEEKAHGLRATGDPDKATIERLRDLHDQQTLAASDNELEGNPGAADEGGAENDADTETYVDEPEDAECDPGDL